MLKSYLLVAWRNLLRNKLFSLINVAGLAIGMASVFLIYLYNEVEHSYDSQVPSADRIFRVPSGYYNKDGGYQRTSAENVPAAGPALKETFPEIEEYARLMSSARAAAVTAAISGESHGESFALVKIVCTMRILHLSHCSGYR
ncbi:MAG: ABC transporter permease [Bacteroidota bacterium]